MEAIAFVDSNYASCIDAIRSVTGFIFFIGSTTISWQSKQQVLVVHSSVSSYTGSNMADYDTKRIRMFIIKATNNV